MYKEFYGLRDKPFTLTPDTNYLYLGRRQQEAIHCLSSGTSSNSRLIILTGEIGSGKTVLLRSFVKELSPSFNAINVLYPTSSCNNRIGLFELVVPSRELRDAIFARATLKELIEIAEKTGYSSFRQDGLIKVAEGLTSYEEVVRTI